MAEALFDPARMAESAGVLPIQPNGAGIPLFLVSPGLECLSLVRHLGPDRPVFGVCVPNLTCLPPPHTIEGMAAECVAVLRRFRPSGPYALCGWCAAGVIALEMARQLDEEGAKVAFVALLDARDVSLPPMNPRQRLLVRSWRFAQKVAFLWSRVRAEGAEPLRQAVITRVARAREARRSARQGLPLSHNDASLEALRHYQPRHWPGRILHIWAAERPKGRFRDPEFILGQLSPGGFVFHEAPGNHLTMLIEPNVAALGGILASELDRWTGYTLSGSNGSRSPTEVTEVTEVNLT
jgi:thioesterase domain-containing protein